MDIAVIADKSKTILEFVETLCLKPDEKIAALKVAASIIENVITIESTTTMMLNYLKRIHCL